MELRKCKECGKMFQPKGREQYCSDTHYRPCPICGQPVVAKYLSDPPRRCDNCKGATKQLQSQISNITVKPMSLKTKSLFNIKPMTVPSMKLQEKKEDPKKPIELKEKEIVIDMTDLEKPADKREIATFCADTSGSTYRFIRKQPLCGWIPGHDYIINVDHDVAAYVITSKTDVTEADSIPYAHGLGLRCASQISFFNYFRRVREE